MTEYLVRWKFGPNSLLNKLDRETYWYQQFHPNKKSAVDHYVSLLQNTMPSSAMTAEIFQMVQLVPGQEEPVSSDDSWTSGTKEPMTIEELVATVPSKQDIDKRNKKIMRMYSKGHTRADITRVVDVSYSTVCSVIKKSFD